MMIKLLKLLLKNLLTKHQIKIFVAFLFLSKFSLINRVLLVFNKNKTDKRDSSCEFVMSCVN